MLKTIDQRSKSSKINGAKGGRPRAPRVELTFRNFFIGEEKGSHKKTVTLTQKAIISETCKHMGDGWGCRVVLTRAQFIDLGGYDIYDGHAHAFNSDFAFIEISE